MEYPECEKFAKVSDVFAQISEYFEHNHYVISEWDGNLLRPVQKSPSTLAYEILEIDMALLEQERQSILDSL